MALMMGCVPLLTKELYSFNFFHEVRRAGWEGDGSEMGGGWPPSPPPSPPLSPSLTFAPSPTLIHRPPVACA